MACYVLLPSPFLGPAVWEPVAALLGPDVVVPAPRGDTPAEIAASFARQIPYRDDLVLVPHSNAGLYVPALAITRGARRLVFADAILPPPRGRTPVAPEGFQEALRGLAGDDGRLPPWTGWWPPDAVDALFPDAVTRANVEREQSRMPFGYLTGSVDAPAGWDARPAVYLAFGDAYADEVADAGRRGWPVRSFRGGHLHMLADPAGVAAAIAESPLGV
ncbi:hypothetical protein J2S43_005181 [Catenuloplanes nepalensis]|uniref:Alpha/beta hydrolase n=1 Tax=Catenuloplanes nepalensis TaxID=587533 RepID=A0ABT9MZ40_9ACTN|nr:hypothetical protein [Catenuloplanes nepalensis]MDP9796669.1 hypothetical protein [Catenuloplanes nepalensis]